MFNDSALAVIDMQKYFTGPEGKAYLSAAPAILPNVAALAKAFREAGCPVIFTRHGHRRDGDAGLMGSWWKGRLLYEDDPQAELAEEIEREAEDIVIRKEYYDAFEKTGLERTLSDADVKTLVICGVMTDLCVETTARRAFTLGYQPVIVEDATASKNDELHRAALTTLAHGFAYIETTRCLLKHMTSS
jgi:nicotinamidase-related amidase